MKEAKGVFGPKIKAKVDNLELLYRNVIVSASESGKLTSALMRNWVERVVGPAVANEIRRPAETDPALPPRHMWDPEAQVCYRDNIAENIGGCGMSFASSLFPEVENYTEYGWGNEACLSDRQERARRSCRVKPEVLLLGDSWSGQTTASVQNKLKFIRAKFLQIPKHTTSQIQPLDVAFNRQYKIFVGEIVEQARREGLMDLVTLREGIINMHSLIWDQFQSPAYRDMLRAAWHNTDPAYDIEELGRNPPARVNEIQFVFDKPQECEIANCTHQAFIRCAHCGKHMCLSHFLSRVHNHIDNPAVEAPFDLPVLEDELDDIDDLEMYDLEREYNSEHP